MASPVNLLVAVASPGSPVTLPDYFIYASCDPESSASFTITNSRGQTTGAISIPITFPPINIEGYAEHIITSASGNINIVYITGL